MSDAPHIGFSAAAPSQPAWRGREPNPDAASLRRVAQEFESFLLKSLLGSMRAAGDALGDETGAPAGGGLVRELVDEQLAIALARRGGLGLGHLLETRLAAEAAAAATAATADRDPSAGATEP